MGVKMFMKKTNVFLLFEDSGSNYEADSLLKVCSTYDIAEKQATRIAKKRMKNTNWKLHNVVKEENRIEIKFTSFGQGGKEILFSCDYNIEKWDVVE